jgi:CheY-like chemotaxis protein
MAKILIVDDDKDILRFTDALLSQSGHDVKVSTDPLTAMDFLNTRHFDLLITDANMPHYTGFELIKTVRSDIRYKELGVAMLTGMRDKAHIEKAIRAGVDDYIVKPIDPLVFIRKIEDLLKKHPPKKQMEVQLDLANKDTQAKIFFDTKIISISEYGVKIIVSTQIHEGALLNLHTNFFNKISIEPPPFRVLSYEKINNEFILNVAFVGMPEADLEKLRIWLQKEINKKRLKVA